MEEFADSINIIQDFNYKLLNIELENKNLEKFIKYYKFYQFTLSASERIEIQKKIKDTPNLPLIIKNNFISETTKDIKDIFISLCNSIVNIEGYGQNDFPERLKHIIIDNGVYLDEKFSSFIPVVFANRELQINKLILEIVEFFLQSSMNVKISDEKQIELIQDKFLMFELFKNIFAKFESFKDDNELIKVFNYLFNCIYVYFDVEKSKRNKNLFELIILCCMPFDIQVAKALLAKLKLRINKNFISINEKDLINFDISELTESSTVEFKSLNIKISCEDINWYLKHDDFLEFLKSDNFMLCFRFPKISEINHLCINDDLKNNHKRLFNKIIKSKIMKHAMNIDEEAKVFQYPFQNDAILEEIENNCFLVPLPAKNYFGITDKLSFTIYLDSFIDTSNQIKVLIDIDNINKSKCHEFKHIYRVYSHINKPDIELKSPEKHYKSFAECKLTMNKAKYIEEKYSLRQILYIYKNVKITDEQKDNIDYGDVLEFAISGDKQNVFFPKNSYFCLCELSWDLSIKDFTRRYFETCLDKEFYFSKKKDNIFLDSIIDNLKIGTNVSISNLPDCSKRSSKQNYKGADGGEDNENEFVFIPKVSHFRKY